MNAAKPNWIFIFILAGLKFILPFVLVSSEFELQRDEYLYYQQGLHLDAGFLENPPFIAVLALVSSLFGNHEWLVTFWPALFGAATLVLTCLITARLGGNTFAQGVAGISIITGAFMRVHALFQPNILDIFFWTLTLYWLLKFILDQNNSRHLYLAGIAFALGLWSKYSIIFLGAAIVLGLLVSRHRKILLQKRALLTLGVTIVVILPNILWQYQHNWPLFHHMEELQQTQLQFLNPSDFLKDQLLILLPVAFVWIAGFIWFVRKKELRFFAWVYFLVIALLLLGRGKSYYALGIYPVLIAAGAVAWQMLSTNRRWIKPALISLIILLSLPFVPLLLPVWSPTKLAAFYEKQGISKTGLLKWEDQRDHPLPQDFADMLGWKEISEKTKRYFDSLPDTVKNNTIIYCRHYGQAGSLKFYNSDTSFTSKVISDNGSFLLWIPEEINFRHLIFIGRRMPGADDVVFNHFTSRVVIDSVINPLSRQFGDKIIFFMNASDSARILAKAGLQEMKNQFRRQNL